MRIFKADARSVLADLDTDGAGRFEAPGLPAGDYRVEVSKPNFVSTTLRMRAAGDEFPSSVLVIRLVRCGAVAGLVLDHAGHSEARRRPSAAALLQPERRHLRLHG